MRNLGHTKTLFITAWKYKWSYKYEHCIICWTCDRLHKGKWKCTACFERLRTKNKILKNNNQVAYQKKIKDNPEFKIYKTKKAKEYYQRNKQAICIINRGKRRKEKDLPCMVLILNWKQAYLPFESIEKPKFAYQDYSEYKKKIKELIAVQTYLKK
jgi:hypothetical protein